jgi:hypothetical protein
MSEKPAMTDDEIETLAWDLEVAMMEIRKDPRAALTAGRFCESASACGSGLSATQVHLGVLS